MNNKKSLFILGLFLLSMQILVAQQTNIYTEEQVLFEKGKTYFEEENYSLAQEKFAEFLDTYQHSFAQPMVLKKTAAAYYYALAAQKQGHPNAKMLLVKFIDEHAQSTYVSKAYYELGQIYFGEKKYREVINVYKQIDPLVLSEASRDKFYFQFAYSYFTNKEFDRAKSLFAQIINDYNEYHFDANYYYGVISFFDKDFELALQSFQRVEKNKRYSKAIPYYITLIYYFQKNYEELLTYAVPKAKSRSVKYRKEINQIVGEIFFERKNYSEALPYLTYYVDNTRKVRKEDIYQLGYTQYKVGNFKKAMKNFQELSSLKDLIGQNAMYHLADCYLRIKDKAKAHSAFDAASRLDHDLTIKEISTFNHAKLSYELGFHSNAISRLQNFIKLYPNSSYSTEAKQLLGQLFETTQNYKDALEVLESINRKDQQLLKTYQRVAYYRGIELYNDHYYDQALALFNKALQNPYNKDITALAHFWKGDIYYKKKKNKEAYKSMQAYLVANGNQPTNDKVMPATARYTMGYALFKEKNYQEAGGEFSRVVNALDGKPQLVSNKNVVSQIYSDAILRNGDCHFMQKEYAQALVNYDNIIKYKLRGSDYAYYQKGMLQGLLGEYDKKIQNLFLINKKYPSSLYNDDALYQIAITQVAQEDYQAAIETHQKLIKDYATSEYVPKSLVSLGLIHYNTGDYDRSLKFYELVLKEYPKSKEGQEALLGVKDVFVAKGDAAGYAKFVKKFPGIKISTSAQDSLAYEIAESYYTKGDCNNAVKEFTKYLISFKNGAFPLYAHFYRGQCLYSQQQYLKAGKDYDYIIAEPNNLFTEQALDKGARIALYIEKNYEKAYQHFEKLYGKTSRKELQIESLRGLVKSSYYLNKSKELDKYAKLLVATGEASGEDKIDIAFYQGMLAYRGKKYSKAEKDFKQVASLTANEKGAQARYYLAEMAYQQKAYESAKNRAFKVINETSGQEYWVVKSFLLLADIYIATGETFQAKATLTSIIENYEPEDQLKKEARGKLAKLEKASAEKSKLKKEDDNDGYLEMDNE